MTATWWLLRDSRQLLADIFIASTSPPPRRCPALIYVYAAASLLISSIALPVFTSLHQENDGRTFPSRTFLLIRAMQTLGPAIGEWQVTGLSYSCYFPALRNTSELPLGPFYFLVIGCGLSVR